MTDVDREIEAIRACTVALTDSQLDDASLERVIRYLQARFAPPKPAVMKVDPYAQQLAVHGLYQR